MNCLDCTNVSNCHSESRLDISVITEAVKDISNGRIYSAIESLELLVIRLEKRDIKKTGR